MARGRAEIASRFGASSRLTRLCLAVALLAGARPYNQSCFAPNAANPSNEAEVPPAGNYFFYLISRMDLCGRESVIGRDSSGTAIPNLAPCP